MYRDYTNASASELAARLIMIDLPTAELSAEDRSHLSSHPWNGVILFSRNVVDDSQTRAYIRSIHECMIREPFIAIDQEGGVVNRFRFPHMSLSPGLLALAKTGDRGAVREAHRIMGEELKNLGIHIDFAPCLDVNNNPANPIIGVRSFGDDPKLVAELGCEAILGLREGGVAPTAKHFPGHGNTSRDSHLALPTINSSLKDLEEVELLPFRVAIKQGVEAIMTAHIKFPALDPELPATLSKTILTGLLREKLGYRGIVVTDSLSMRSIADRWGFGEATVLSIEAGADLVLALGTFSEQNESLQALTKAIESNRISRSRIEESLKRLDDLQERYNGLPQNGPEEDNGQRRQRMEAITANTVEILRNEDNILPLRLNENKKLLIIAPDMLPQSPLGEMEKSTSWSNLVSPFWNNCEELTFNLATAGPAIGEIAKKATSADAVLLLLYSRGRISDSQIDIAKEVMQANSKTIVIPLSSPYIFNELPEIRNCITAYNYGEMSLRALFSRIFT